jgi:hypothetical protein
MLPRDGKPKKYVLATCCSITLDVDKKWHGKRAIVLGNGARPPFVDLTIKLDAEDLADDIIDDYFDNDDYINVVSERICIDSSLNRHVYNNA